MARGMSAIAGDSIHAVTVPGAIDAWAAILDAHGSFSLDRALAPAIHYAEHGFPVAGRIAWDWAREVGKLRADAGAARHFLFDGVAPAEGDVVKLRQQPAKANRDDEESQRPYRIFDCVVEVFLGQHRMP